MRPQLKFLSDELIQQIISEARKILSTFGVEIHNETALNLLSDHGAKIDFNKSKAFINETIIDKSLASVPESFKLFNALGKQTNDFSDDNVHFTPGSSALNFLDYSPGPGLQLLCIEQTHFP